MRTVARVRRQQCGTSMIEVLVTLVVIAFGLLGMAGLQARLQASEVDAYQRSQALLLLDDMANRIAVNRTAAVAGAYVTGASSPLGVGMTCPTATGTRAQQDLMEWCESLQGAGEVSGSTKAGAMVGGRGCVENVGGDFMVTVAWQGMTPVAAPPASVGCGAGQYDAAAGAPCSNDLCRRAVTTIVRIGKLL